MTDPIHIDTASIQAKSQQLNEEAAEAQQVASDESFEVFCEDAFNPWAADKDKKDKFKSLENRSKDLKEVEKEQQLIKAVDRHEESAKRFHEKNDELQQQLLLRLLRSLKKNDTIDDILKKAENVFSDAYLQDEALEFLAENAGPELAGSISGAKDELHKRAGSQIVAGRNIKQQTREFSEKGLGSPTALRDLYQEITTGTPKETTAQFEELSKSYSFDKLKTVIQFLLHSLGGDLRSKGPSISRGELARLFNETRSLQTILGVYRFFQSRINLMKQLFANAEIAFPQNLTFESMAKLFMKLLEERYPTAMKILRSAGQLGPEQEIAAMLIIISQWRDAVRNVAPRLYKTPKQRDDILNAIMEALEEIEEQEEERRRKIIEEEEEKERKKKEEEKKKKKANP